ncbi:hypothetical protein HIF96_00025 [Helcococcus kunzii]|uniref:hypothetical protein n=1 Tax=Helcococcus kunzii TaxID=40091 RepID=UPI001C946E95|nr:hypothetical protein [Helcococcus kunzii]MCT1796533.1 hypothetical protein [Helcococcus kunzii]MCT1989642.1 hypothetical protein [Helcococcus kunzii]QZO76448.1 hypothetical protein HIF96_00025 [Helcococcus kunzii]
MSRIRKVSNTIIFIYIASIIFQMTSLILIKKPDQSFQELLKNNLMYTIRFMSIFLFIISFLLFFKIRERYKMKIDNEAIVLTAMLLISNAILQQLALIVGFIILMYFIIRDENISLKNVFSNINLGKIKLEFILSILLILISIFVQFAYFKI